MWNPGLASGSWSSHRHTPARVRISSVRCRCVDRIPSKCCRLPGSVDNRFLLQGAPLGMVDLQSLGPVADGDKDSDSHPSLGVCCGSRLSSSRTSSLSHHGSPMRWGRRFPHLPGDRGSAYVTCWKSPPSPSTATSSPVAPPGSAESVSVSPGCCDVVPRAGWLINDRNSFLPVLDAGRRQSQCLGRARSRFTDGAFSLCPHEEALWGPF